MGEVVKTDFVCFNPLVVGDFVVLIVVVVDSIIDCVVVAVDFGLDIVDSMLDLDCMTRHPRSKNEQINLIMQIGDGVCLAKFVNYRLYLLSFTIYE